MNSTINSSILAAVLLVLTGCGTQPPEQTVPEQCSNGLDDDKNGFADCADTACVADPACVDEPFSCASQEECLGGHSYAYFTRGLELPDGGPGVLRPIPMCSEQACVTPAGQVSIRLDIKLDNYGGESINAVNTRFVKKTAVDGMAVTCATLTEVAGSNTAAANTIEASKRFNLQAYDAVSMNATSYGGPGTFISVFMDANVGADFIIWVELWAQKLDSNTRLPTGKRYGYSCVESGAQVAELTAADHDVRSITLTMPAPQNP